MPTPRAPGIKKIEVAAVFEAYPAKIRRRLMQLRELIYATARTTPGVADIEECLKWGQPSYANKSGTTVRIDFDPKNLDRYALFVPCQTDLVATFRRVHPRGLEYEGKRAIWLNASEPMPAGALKDCIALALRYRLDKKEQKKNRNSAKRTTRKKSVRAKGAAGAKTRRS